MAVQCFGGHFAGFPAFEPRVACLRGFVRLNARRAEHHDGVANALVLELYERMNVFGEDANRPRRHAAQKLGVFMGDLGRVLRLQFFAVGHVSTLP